MSRGYCAGHYQRLKNNNWDKSVLEPLRVKYPKGEAPPCKINGCDEECHAKGYCQYHYNQQLFNRPFRLVPKHYKPRVGNRKVKAEQSITENDMELWRQVEVELKKIRDRDADVYKHCEEVAKINRLEMENRLCVN